MDFDYSLFAYVCVSTLFLGLVFQNLNIRLAHKFKLLDIPTSRRRHARSTPITGGLGVFLSWVVGVGVWCLFQPAWFFAHQTSLLVVGGSLITLVGMGLLDDLKGLTPFWKLVVELFVAITVITFEPEVNSLCRIWSEHLGILVWPIAALWIVGITNAINLIDGLDGLAGGMSTLVAISIFMLSCWTGNSAIFATVTMGLLVPSLMGFLRYNWAPAKIFLGDNGSLPIGFMLATSSLMCRPNNKSWILLASLIIMLGYPILDMGLAVWRRWMKKFPLFKADRNHLHFRILRLGPTTSQTAFLLLSIGLYLQVVALCVNLTSQAAAVMGLALAIFSISSLLYLVRSIERWRVRRLYGQVLEESGRGARSHSKQSVLRIDLEPLLEAALFEEQKRFKQLVSALELMISTMVRFNDTVYFSDQEITVVFGDYIESDKDKQITLERFRSKMILFLDMYNLQCSLASLPIRLDEMQMIKVDKVASERPLRKAA